jgi:cyanophycinase
MVETARSGMRKDQVPQQGSGLSEIHNQDDLHQLRLPSSILEGYESSERLVLIGGGNRPREALARFCEWAGGSDSTIMVIPWATTDPRGAFETIRDELRIFSPHEVIAAPELESMNRDKSKFLRDLARSTGVYFTGGDQNRIMDLLKDSELYDALHHRYAEGVVFAGTSAGTAIMSKTMLTGKGEATRLTPDLIETREGLGLFEDVILDQHFLARQRFSRLFAVLMGSKEEIGIGIDEDGALAVENSRLVQVVGPEQVAVVIRDGDCDYATKILNPGDAFDLQERHRIPPQGKAQATGTAG